VSKKLKYLSICFVVMLILQILISNNIFAQSAKGILGDNQSKWRPLVSKHAGEKWAIKFFGVKEEVLNKNKNKLKMPDIPKVKKDATSIDVYKVNRKNPEKFNKLTTDQIRSIHYNYVVEMYQTVRKQDAPEEELQKWINVLDQGGSYEGVYRALVLDNYYASLEQNNVETSAQMAEKINGLFSKFLKRKVKKQILINMNPYTLKRLVVEKFLEVGDALIQREIKDFETWYAILSIDFAKDHQNIWQKKIRKISKAKVQKKWLEKMPLQIIKVEMIIKLNKVMNSYIQY
jgi:hypothetical protein